MAIKVGDKLPDGTLTEMIDTEREGCTIGPNAFNVSDLAKGKKIVIFGVPGAFTPTCSAKHVPGYTANYDKLKARKVDEIWCMAVNDAFVMGAWAKDQKSAGKVRMMARISSMESPPLRASFGGCPASSDVCPGPRGGGGDVGATGSHPAGQSDTYG
jgi:peroxiredoxin